MDPEIHFQFGAGLAGKSRNRAISMAEVKQHRSKDDAWLVLKGKVTALCFLYGHAITHGVMLVMSAPQTKSASTHCCTQFLCY